MRKLCYTIFLIFLLSSSIFASDSASGHGMIELMTEMVFQLGVIIFAARIGGVIFGKLKLPSVLGELFAGIIIGPFMLGSLSIPGFSQGLFPLVESSSIVVSPQLYGIATIASILLLFIAGLETDLTLFIKYSLTGSLVGIGGVFVSFTTGVMCAVLFLGVNVFDPIALFLGVMSSATSVGITARVLSGKKKMDSPEGVTILSGAVIDDVLGIIALAVVLGMAVKTSATTGTDWSAILAIATKAVIVWISFTISGLLFGRKLSSILKKSGDPIVFSVLSLGLAFIMAGIFEKAGLAMIIGAYIMGLSLSRTDISYVIQEKLHPVQQFLVPVFFTVMGMMVNLKVFLSADILILGIIYSLFAVVAKVLGSGLPAMFLNFNARGALRIGLGMVPRGEVALIMAGIGLTSGIIDEKIFGVSVMMTLLTTLAGPPLLSLAFKGNKKGVKKDVKQDEKQSLEYAFPSVEIVNMVASKVITSFGKEEFFINMIDSESRIYHIRKDDVFLTLSVIDKNLRLSFAKDDTLFVKTVLYESLVDFNRIIEAMRDFSKPEELKKDILSEPGKVYFDIGKYLNEKAVCLNLESEDKNSIINELCNILVRAYSLEFCRKSIVNAVFERENGLSTGMQDTIALPHGKSDCVDDLKIAVGIKKTGVDFDSLDQKPAKIFILVVSPEGTSGPHVQLLSGIASVLNSESFRNLILECSTSAELISLFKKSTNK